MNNRTSFALLVVLTAVVTLTMSSAYATGHNLEGFPMYPEEAKALAQKLLLEDLPVSVWTDKTEYGHNDIIMVKGQVANVSGFPITVSVVSPLNSLVTIDQITVESDGSFETTLNTAGALWKYDGTYTIKVTYGNQAVNNRALVELTGGIIQIGAGCGPGELSASGQCIPYTITAGSVSGAMFSAASNSLTVQISGLMDGTLTITPSVDAIRGIFMVLVDGEEWDDVEINGNEVIVHFPAGTNEIEIIGTFAIPEFGTIAALILVVSIISIIVVSSRTRLNVLQRY